MKKCTLIIAGILVFSLMISCESTVQQSEFKNNQNKLIEKAEAYLLSNISAQEVKFQEVLETEGFKVPAFRVESEPNTLYMVFTDKKGTPKRVLIQQHQILQEDKVKYLHYLSSQDGVSRQLVGTMTVNKQGELLAYKTVVTAKGMMPCTQDGKEIPCGSGDESCTGYHYRKMMEAIESNGDTKVICDGLGIICSAEVWIAAYAHCKGSH